MSWPRPRVGEYDSRYDGYLSLVPDGPIGDILERQIDDTCALVRAVPLEREQFRYRPDKWSLREVVGHVIDFEYVLLHRLTWLARHEGRRFDSFDQDLTARGSPAGARPLAALIAEWRALRPAVVAAMRGVTEEAWSHRGEAGGSSFTVATVPWIVAGHELHHRRVLLERYLT